MRVKILLVRLAVATTALALLVGCTITPPAVSNSPNDPSNPYAAEGATGPLRPRLVAGAKTDLSPSREPDAAPMQQHSAGHHMQKPLEAAVGYTCPMHPEIHQDKPGRCPKCGMNLVAQTGERP